MQPGLWGEAGADRAHRAAHRVQGLLGPDAVLIGVPSGGRDPHQLVTPVPFGDEPIPARPPAPWPGRIPPPYPTLNLPGEPARLLDADGAEVRITARLEMTGAPARLETAGRSTEVVAWWGPWPVDERWWDPADRRRGVRLQVELDGDPSVLLFLTDGRWHVTGHFD